MELDGFNKKNLRVYYMSHLDMTVIGCKKMDRLSFKIMFGSEGFEQNNN